MPTHPPRLLFISKSTSLHPPKPSSHRHLWTHLGRLSKHLASQLGPSITVNTLALGPFRSKMMAATLDSFEKEIAGSLPMGRIGKGEDVAGACLWLSSKAGEWVTGYVLSSRSHTYIPDRDEGIIWLT